MSELSYYIRPINFELDEFLPNVLNCFIDCEFDETACKQGLDNLIAHHKISSDLFESERILTDGLYCTNALLSGNYDDYDHYQVTGVHRDGSFSTKELNNNASQRELKRIHAQSNSLNYAEKHGTWPELNAPGIYRREHASVAIKSHQTTILTDPQSQSGSWTTDNGRYPADNATLYADAICITHAHHDHWHIPSILAHTQKTQSTILVPTVRTNLLSLENPKKMLDDLTQLNSVACDWWSTHRIGDIDITTLPFYGEQPTRSIKPVNPDLRNWGNCYRFCVDGRSIVILADSGIDPEGSAIDMLKASCKQHGPVDFLLSCCGTFDEIINSGLPEYLFSVPFHTAKQEYLNRQTGKQINSITLGLDGIVQACKVTEAKYFLPYAHGFSGIGNNPMQDDDEKRLMQSLEKLLNDQNVATEIIDWLPGDHIDFSDYCR